jgi:molybdenum cofactor cytidylyltransferase
MRSPAAVILAAGESVRFGRPKQLLTFRGKTLLRATVDSAHEAGCAPIAVVVPEVEQTAPASVALRHGIERALAGSEAILVENSEWRLGVGTSIRAGVRAIGTTEVEAVVLLVPDQPYVDSATIALLRARRTQTGKRIVASAYAETVGVPALFDRSLFDALTNLPNNHGAKALILSRPEEVAEIVFPDGAADIDTPADWERVQTESITRPRS